jgi:hypothetical protein
MEDDLRKWPGQDESASGLYISATLAFSQEKFLMGL